MNIANCKLKNGWIAALLACLSAPWAWAQEVITLHRGINLTHWLAPWAGDYVSNVRSPLAAVDVAYLQSLGFDHIRLVVDPEKMWNEKSPGAPYPVMVATLGEAIAKLIEAGFRVVIDMQPFEEPTKNYVYEPRRVKEFEVYWKAMARYLRRWDPKWLAMELLNEPRQTDAEKWRLQAKALVRAIRTEAPNHTIIVGAHEWSRVDNLLQLKPVDEPKIIYAFHFYDPQDFTHQGFKYGADLWKTMKEVPYPFTPERIRQLLAGPAITDQQTRNWLEYAANKKPWNAELVAAAMKSCADWGRRHDVPVWCGEFGVFPAFCKPEDRLAYLRDVRVGCEQAGIPWCVWEYQGNFNLIKRDQTGRPLIDAPTLRALGLNEPQP